MTQGIRFYRAIPHRHGRASLVQPWVNPGAYLQASCAFALKIREIPHAQGMGWIHAMHAANPKNEVDPGQGRN
jgi:hypothetical protein